MKLLTAGAILLASLGCTSLFTSVIARKVEIPPGPKEVRYGGKALDLGEVGPAALTPEKMFVRVQELIPKGESKRIARIVDRHPDVALELLNEASPEQCGTTALETIAVIYDQNCTRTDAAFGWKAMIADREKHPARYERYLRDRQRFEERLQTGRPVDALAIRLEAPKDAPGPMLAMECYRLQGLAHLMNNEPQKAIEPFKKGVELAKGGHPLPATQLSLWLSEAHRRSGDAKKADERWRQAVEIASAQLAVDRPVADPILWERIAYLRPVSEKWPDDTQRSLARFNDRLGIHAEENDLLAVSFVPNGQVVNDEVHLWARIGDWRLERSEPQQALVAFKRAESMCSDEATRGWLRLAEARALAELGQNTSAAALLTVLIGQTKSPVVQPAMAMFGALKLQDGSIQQGFLLLRKAVEGDDKNTWAFRSQAEADLGLAYLMLDDEAKGLHWLHSAQKKFESEGANDLLVQSLENEAAFLDHKNRNKEAKEVRNRLKVLASSG